MELNRTVRTLSNILKNFETTESCSLSEVSVRTSGVRDLIERLIDHLESIEFFSEKTDDELRSLHFFLLLNTSLGITEELEGNADIGHAVGAVPPITAYVYLMLCAELDLIKYLKEVIEFGPLRIVNPTLNAVSANLRYLQPCHYFNVLAAVLATLFARFQRIEAASAPQTLFDTFQVFLLYYKEDESATDFDSRLAAGYKWLSLLRLLRQTCRIRFSKKWKTAPPAFYDIKINEPKDEETNKNTAMAGFYDRILYKCRAFADILDMNLFMAWHEVEDNGNTLQSIIGTEAYKLRVLLEKCQKVNSLPAEASELIEILKSVQREPDKKTQTKEEKLDRDELRDRIIKKSEFDSRFIAEAEMLIKEDATVLDFEMTKTFVRKLCSNSMHGVKEETIKNLVWLLLRGMEFNDITSFVGEFVECYGLHSVLYQSNINLSPHIEDLNTVNTDDEEKTLKIFKEIIILAFSAAPQVLAVLLKEGCTEKNKRSKIVDILDTLKSVCLHCNEESSTHNPSLPLLMNVVQKFFESGFLELDVTERYNFFELVEELCQKNLIQANTFLHRCLLHSLDVRENWLILSEILTFMQKFVNDNRENLKLNLPKIFLQLLRVIESTRWNIITFTPERLKACEEGIDVLELIRDLFPVAEYSSEMEELFKSGTYRFSDLTRVYFMDICSNFLNDSIESKIISLIRKPLQLDVSRFVRRVEEEATFTLRLGELLPRLTSKELQSLVTNFASENATNLTFILDFVSHGISFIGSCAAHYSTMPQVNSSAIISCIGQMLNNFLVVLQVNWPNFLAADQKFYFIKYVKRIAAVLQEFPSHLVQPYQFNLIKFVDDSLIKLKDLNSETEMTDIMLQEFDRNIRQLFVGFALL